MVSLFTYLYINPDGSVFYAVDGGGHRGSYFQMEKQKSEDLYMRMVVPTIDDKGTTIQIDCKPVIK